MMIDYLNTILAAGTAAVSVLSIVNVWLVMAVNAYKRTIEQIRLREAETAKEIAAVRELVAGQYVTQSRFDQAMKQQQEAMQADLQRQTDTILGALKAVSPK